MQLVNVNNGKATTTSVKVAEYFGKPHNDVLKAIRVLLEDQDILGRGNFSLTSYVTDQNKEMPMYALDRDGFTLLAMGFTGKKALTFKLSYIDAFNKAEKALLEIHAPATPEMQIANAIMLAGRMIEEQKSQIEQRDKVIAMTVPKAAIADRISISDGLFGFRQVAKMLRLNENKFKAWLVQNDWIYYLGKRMTVKAYWLQKGFAETKIKLIQMDNGDEKAVVDMYITSKGVHYLASKLCPHDLNESTDPLLTYQAAA